MQTKRPDVEAILARCKDRKVTPAWSEIETLCTYVLTLEAQVKTARRDVYDDAATKLRSVADVAGDDCHQESLREAARIVLQIRRDMCGDD